MFGYETKHGTCPIFITYHKDDESAIDYGDEFINQREIKWYGERNKTLKYKKNQDVINSVENGVDLHIYVRKSDKEREFYYLGKSIPIKETIELSTMSNDKGREVPVIHMNLMLQRPVESSIYRYLIKDVTVKLN